MVKTLKSKSLMSSVDGYHELINIEETSCLQSSGIPLKSINSQHHSIPNVSSVKYINSYKDEEGLDSNSQEQSNVLVQRRSRRVVRLYVFGFFLPVLFIAIPLYIRLVLYPPLQYVIAPTDQRLIHPTSSSVWCQSQRIHMNGTFNAYLMPTSSKLEQHFSTHSMAQHLTLKNDVQEYWGFYLHKDSIVSISLCTKHDGVSLMIIRGAHNLKTCAWIEEDNTEQNKDNIVDLSNSREHQKIYEHNESDEPLKEIDKHSSVADFNLKNQFYPSLMKLSKGLIFRKIHINMTSSKDTSTEDQSLSFSSSETALTECKGLIGMTPLYSNDTCHGFNDSHINQIKYSVPVTGTYYFVFSSDNEASDVYLNMSMKRVVYGTEAATYSCFNKSDCSLIFPFWSDNQAIIEVSEGDWNAVYVVMITCQPRVAIYLSFLFIIPILILFCAYH